MRRRSALLAIFLFLAIALRAAEPLIRHVEELASPSYRGRLAGTDDERRAADYLARQLAALGAQPIPGASGYLHEFPLPAELARPRATGINVLGWLPATTSADGATSSGIVLLGAHYDHVGDGLAINGAVRAGKSGPVHPGADDNASGVAVMLGAAARLAQFPPAQPVLIAFWSAEESGLLGSQHFARTWDFRAHPVGRIVTADMVGHLRDRGLQLDCAHFGASDHARVVQLATANDVAIKFVSSASLSTDSRSFDALGVPSLTLHTGVGPDYEGTGDTPDRIDAAGLEKLAHFTAEFARAMPGPSVIDLDRRP